MGKQEVLFYENKGWGISVLNRPEALNALNLDMVRMLSARLKRWQETPGLNGVVIRGEGRAFCSGGDIKGLLKAVKNNNHALVRDFFREEYSLNRQIRLFPKFYVALLDGIVMGGGAGISIHGVYRIATENTLFAMPETGIGFFPDVGASYFLSRLPGQTGMFLALTGSRIGASDMVYLGLATHCVPSSRIDDVLEALINCDLHEMACREVDPIIKDFSVDPGPSGIKSHRKIIDQCFGESSVERIVGALEEQNDKWAHDIRKEMLSKSPTSLKVTFKLLRNGRELDFDSALKMEYRLSQRMVYHNDYFEGVSSTVIDKSKRPLWDPPSLDTVHDDTVDSLFAPLPEGELEF